MKSMKIPVIIVQLVRRRFKIIPSILAHIYQKLLHNTANSKVIIEDI